MLAGKVGLLEQLGFFYNQLHKFYCNQIIGYQVRSWTIPGKHDHLAALRKIYIFSESRRKPVAAYGRGLGRRPPLMEHRGGVSPPGKLRGRLPLDGNL